MNKPVVIWGSLGLVSVIFAGIVGFSIINPFINPPDTDPPAAGTAADCATTYVLNSTATDRNGNPIAAASIMLRVVGELAPNPCPLPTDRVAHHTTTNAAGEFSLSIQGGANWLYQLSITAPHYQPYMAPPVNGVYLPYFAFTDIQLQPITVDHSG